MVGTQLMREESHPPIPDDSCDAHGLRPLAGFLAVGFLCDWGQASTCPAIQLKNGASLEDASTVEREWLYVTPHSHSPTHYRDDSLFVFPIREKYLYSYTTARAVHRCKFLLLKDLL